MSKGSEVYDTNPIIWPITEPTPKIDALIQCAGEAKYCNDEVSEPKEVYCAFVTSDICTGEIVDIDPTPALVSKTYLRCEILGALLHSITYDSVKLLEVYYF